VTNILDELADRRLGELHASGLIRIPDDGLNRLAAQTAACESGQPFIDASSNDYLGFADLDVSRETSVQVSATGAGASRLVHGTRGAQVRLEQALANWVQLPRALLFASGYAANVGLIAALGSSEVTIFSDELNHASIIDGCRLSRATVRIVPHLDLTALEQGLRASSDAGVRLVVTEACFSMDGDGPDLRALHQLCTAHAAALIVDEAHSLGVFGPYGAGRCVAAGVVPDALVGTLGKAVGTQGAFVAGSAVLRSLLWNKARSFVFSTATSPLLAEATLLHVERAKLADDLRVLLTENARALRRRLCDWEISVPPGLDGPIVPVLVGDNARAVRVATVLASQGILTQAIRPPTVPAGRSRIRLTANARWPEGAVDRIAGAVARAIKGSYAQE
jgi:8-amino-7-oxononanoate synthase